MQKIISISNKMARMVLHYITKPIMARDSEHEGEIDRLYTRKYTTKKQSHSPATKIRQHQQHNTMYKTSLKYTKKFLKVELKDF